MVTDLSKEKIRREIEAQINLPSPPAIAVQILNTIQSEDSSLEDLEKIISADPSLTGKMLQIANSAFYALPNKVSSITHAMSILGTNVIKNIALSFVITNDLRNPAIKSFDFDFFWRRSVTTAVSAEVLKNLTKKEDDIFVTALLQDLGVLILFLNKGHEYTPLLSRCRASNSDYSCLVELEQEKFQFDHQQIGCMLTRKWKLPLSISEPICHHHSPEDAPEEYRETARILSLANLVSTIYNGPETAENIARLQILLKEQFAIDKKQTADLLDDVARKTIAILGIFELDPGQMKPYSQMLQEANNELGRLNLSYEQLVMALKESKEKSERFARQLQEANAKLENLAFRDGLTNVYNHRYFQEIFEKEIARAQRYNGDLCLIMFDIDFFKKVNDTYGHPTGDQILILLAERIQKAIRPSDILARYGGEEFTVILPETKTAGMKVFAERLRHCAMEPFDIDGNSIKITISVGGVYYDLDLEGATKQHLIDTADRALYQSKQNGRNRVTILPLSI
jgi:diguanylate cyclase (GGDEF)-like protein